MPPRDQDLPEGTDKIVAGASKTDTGAGSDTGTGTGTGGARGGSGGGGSGGGFVARGSANDTGDASDGGSGAGFSADKIVGQVREQVTNLREQATGKAREFAEGGKDRTTQLLDDLSEIIHDAARSIDDRLGDQYGEYAHKAGDAIAGLAGNLRDKSLEDLVEGTRSIVRKSPAVTVGTAALLGFVLVRLVKSGLEPNDGGGTGDGGGRTGGGRSGGGA
ncbi:MAG TPA: hypothetical protein VF603_06740 [Allosphingosinicella sp.]|jgi:ElaB/YqjD/DUF883 family membrane-anchored ribosome-binding protein